MINNKNILIIEDDFDLLWLIKKILLLNGFEVLTAVTAEQAIDTYSRNIFNIRLVIMDISLPDQSGEVVCREFMKANPEIPIIIMTGYEDREQQEKLEKLGVRDYLIKPFDIMQLIKSVSKII